MKLVIKGLNALNVFRLLQKALSLEHSKIRISSEEEDETPSVKELENFIGRHNPPSAKLT